MSCPLQILTCDNGGCQYKCTRRDMDAHLRRCLCHQISPLDVDYRWGDESIKEIVLFGCGLPVVNGIYQEHRPTGRYFKLTNHQGERRKVVLCQDYDGRWLIYIAPRGNFDDVEDFIKDDLYITVESCSSGLPTRGMNWIAKSELAVDPPPDVVIIKEEHEHRLY